MPRTAVTPLFPSIPALLPVLITILAGCDPIREEGLVSSFVIRDSSGVEIVESRAPLWTDEDRWRVGDTRIEIGALSGALEYQFNGVAGGFLINDDRIVVADGGSAEIRVFRPDGTLESRWGRSGDGPGEYRLIQALGRARGDSAWIYDFSLRRITFISLTDGGARVAPLTPPTPNLGAVGEFSDGTFLLAQFWSSSGMGFGVEPGVRRDPSSFVLYGTTGDLVDTLTTVRGREIAQWVENGRTVMSAPLFMRMPVWALARDGFFSADQERFEVKEHDRWGRLVRILRLTDIELTISEEDFSAELTRRLDAEGEEDRVGLERLLRDLPRPDTRPAHGELLVDRAGHLWVEGVGLVDQGSWRVFDVAGVFLGTVRLPRGMRPLWVGEKELLAVAESELGVETVQVLELEKPRP